MKQLRRILLILFLFVLLAFSILAADGSVTSKDDLSGKKLLLLGDSYSAHHKLPLEKGWPYLICQEFGMTLYDYAISGSSFGGGEKGRYPMVERYKSAMEEHYDIVILQGGSNDWSHNIPLGDVDSRDETTMLGAMNRMLDEFQAAWPDATIICFTPWVSTGAKNGLGLDTDDYVAAIAQLCQARSLILYDASDPTANGIHMNQEAFRRQYSLTATDRWHLNTQGQALFAQSFAQWLRQTLLNQYSSDRFVDMTTAESDLKEAVSLVYEAGIMNGISDVLFAPAQGATRGTLAVTLYRMAGSPEVSIQQFSDVAPDSSLISPISWAVETGILAPDGTSFSPNSLLHRQELVTALYCYYAKIQTGSILELMGLRQYTDWEQIPSESRTAWGWFLTESFLTPTDNLHPQALVSRGQLATALSILKSME